MSMTLRVDAKSKRVESCRNVYVGNRFAGTYFPAVGTRDHGFHFCGCDGLTLADVNLSELFTLIKPCKYSIGIGFLEIETDVSTIPVYDHK